MAAAANAAPVQSTLGADAADDSSLTAGKRLFDAMPVFLTLENEPQWLRGSTSIERESEYAARLPEAYLAAYDSGGSASTPDLLSMLLWALEDERVDAATSSFGPSPIAPQTFVAERA